MTVHGALSSVVPPPAVGFVGVLRLLLPALGGGVLTILLDKFTVHDKRLKFTLIVINRVQVFSHTIY